MSVYANGHLIYGFVHTDDTEDLFEMISAVEPDEMTFEEIHPELQKKHSIYLSSVGYDGIDALSAYSANVSCKGFNNMPINAEDLATTAEYDQKIKAFLADLGIDPSSYTPGWHLLSYMD